MFDQARKYVIRTAGMTIILLALGAALLPMERGFSGRLVVGWLLVAAGVVELIAAMARRIHKPSAAIAGAATVLAGLRLTLDANANFFPVLNMVILWLIIRTAALAFAASRSQPPLRGWFPDGFACSLVAVAEPCLVTFNGATRLGSRRLRLAASRLGSVCCRLR